MSTLYEITDEYIDILLDCGNIDALPEEMIKKLENINEKFDEKAGNIALIINELKSDCERIEAEEKRLKSRREVKLKNMERLKEYLKGRMGTIGKSKIDTPLCTISVRKSVKTEVDDKFIDWAIENKFKDLMSEKTSYIPNKKLIKEQLESGELDCPYARLTEGQSLVIR